MKKVWPKSTLGDASPISNRKLKAFAEERPYFSTGAVGPEGELFEPVMVTFAMRPSRAGCMPRSGDVGFAKMKGTKKVLLIDEAQEGSLFSTGFCFLVPKPHVEPRFLFYFITSDDFQSAKDAVAGKGIMGGIKNQDAAQIQVPVPPLAEQLRIVGVLDGAFAGLATAQAHAAQNLQNARALFESHLQSIFTQRGKGWVEKTLEGVSTNFGRGKSKHRPRNAKHLYGGKYPFVQTGDIRNADHIVTEYSQTYSEAGLAQSKLWPKGTICITIAANIAETAILGFDACFPDSVIGVVANPKEADVGFTEYLLQSFKAQLQAMGQGSAQANINMGTFENQRFPFAPVAAQKQIAAKFDALATEIQRLESLYGRKQAALAALKKSLLHQAFSGAL